MAVLGSPFTAGAAANLPATKIGAPSRLVLRVDDATGSDKIYFSTNGQPASATNAQGFLNDGESIEIFNVHDASQVSIFAGSGTPLIFWGVL